MSNRGADLDDPFALHSYFAGRGYPPRVNIQQARGVQDNGCWGRVCLGRRAIWKRKQACPRCYEMGETLGHSSGAMVALLAASAGCREDCAFFGTKELTAGITQEACGPFRANAISQREAERFYEAGMMLPVK